jgi:hypothetical protein
MTKQREALRRLPTARRVQGGFANEQKDLTPRRRLSKARRDQAGRRFDFDLLKFPHNTTYAWFFDKKAATKLRKELPRRSRLGKQTNLGSGLVRMAFTVIGKIALR